MSRFVNLRMNLTPEMKASIRTVSERYATTEAEVVREAVNRLLLREGIAVPRPLPRITGALK